MFTFYLAVEYNNNYGIWVHNVPTMQHNIMLVRTMYALFTMYVINCLTYVILYYLRHTELQRH